MRVYVDTDVLIWHLRGEHKAEAALRRLARKPDVELWTAAMQRAEIVFFMRESEERATQTLLAQFRVQSLTAEMVDLGASFYRRWHPSHGTGINDALLAATVATTGGR